MTTPFEQYRARFRPADYQRYLDRLAAEIGHRYTYSTTPLFLPRERLERIFESVHAVVRLLASPVYQAEVARAPWFLAGHPLRRRDLFGCVDFHLQGEEEKIIEVNFNPPGRFGLHELMERCFLETFETPTRWRINAGFEQAVVAAATEGEASRRVAIAVNPTSSSRELLPHYRHVERFFHAHGVEARVVYADRVTLDANGFPCWDGVAYDVVFSLLIARTWQDHPELFAPFTELHRRRPEVFFPSPFGARLGDKRLLCVLDRLDQERFGLGAEDLETLRRVTLPALRLTDCAGPAELAERLGGNARLVLKPFDNYRGNGVVIQPNDAQLAEIFAQHREGYMAQALFEAEPVPVLTPDGALDSHPFELRVVFLNGEVRSLRGSSCLNLDMTPVVAV